MREAVILFFACMVIYLSNGSILSTGDSIPNTLLGFNLLDNHRWDFDNFRGSYYQSNSCYWFVNTPGGHFVAKYPIGPAIVSFPVCVCFWTYMKLMHPHIDITSSAFEPYRQSFEHLAAGIVASLCVLLFYLCSRLMFARKTALTSTFIFAFATSMWTTCALALFQHGIACLMLLATFYCLLRANRQSTGRGRGVWLLAAGLCCGLLPVVRPAHIVFVFCALLYCLMHYRAQAAAFLIGMVSVVPGLLYNCAYFGIWLGGYVLNIYDFSFANLKISGWGLGPFLCPNRGLFIYSPVLIFSFVGLWRLIRKARKFSADDGLVFLLTGASVINSFVYCFFLQWHGGWCYGPRYMTEALPMLGFLLNYFLSAAGATPCVAPAAVLSLQSGAGMTTGGFPSGGIDLSPRSGTGGPDRRSLANRITMSIFVLLAAFSVFVQVVGAFGPSGFWWNAIPSNITVYPDRVWSWRNGQIEWHTRAFFQRLSGSPQSGIPSPVTPPGGPIPRPADLRAIGNPP